MAKNKEFKLPYLSIDEGILYGPKGEMTVSFKVTNTSITLEGDTDSYDNFHSVFSNIVGILGEGHIVQKIDIFSSQTFNEDIGKEFLQKKYDEHFNGRKYKQLDTYLHVTRRNDSGTFSQKHYNEFFENVAKIHDLLNGAGFKPVRLTEKDIEHLIYRTLTMDFSSKHLALDNFKPSETHIEIGENIVKALVLIDNDRVDLPSTIAPYIERNDMDGLKGFPVDNMAFLNSISDFQTLVYHQVVEIPGQQRTLQEMELKKRRHSGMPDSANDIAVQDIEELIEDVAKNNQTLVKCHFAFFVCGEKEKVTKACNFIETSLFTQGIIPSKVSFNQFELFKAILPGNAIELKKYDQFPTTSDAALSFFFKEALPVSEKSKFFFRFTDRQGIPIKVDPYDLPYDTQRIQNRNMFLLGPSGSGKSFLTNAMVEIYLNDDSDVVIVDTGHSYKGLCTYFNGKYLTYSPSKPITMNPFVVSQEELAEDIEKRNFLVSLILLLWKESNGIVNQIERDVVNECMISYYDTFFNGQDSSFLDNMSIRELEQYLINKGVSIHNLLEKARIALIGQTSEVKNYYQILRVHKDDTYETIKKQYRRLALKYHPDKNDTDEEIFLEIQEAYDVLSDDDKRAEYDMIAKIDQISREIELDPKAESYLGTELEIIYRTELIAKAKEIFDEYRINRLCFNTFYEYALKTIPLIIKREEIQFQFTDFRFVLKKFYKGGEFDSILNENVDQSLFHEKFIVFEIDNIKDHKVLFPIVTLIIMDVFLQKIRFRPAEMKKILIIEEAWKAIGSPTMADYLKYLFKTIRKFYGQAIIVTQELTDIISNETLKNTIVTNSDEVILLDQSRLKENFKQVADLLGLNEVEKRKIFTINKLNNRDRRGPFKEFYFKRGSSGEVYGNEVSIEQYLTYTTEKPEKAAVEIYVEFYGSYEMALERIVKDLNHLGLSFNKMKDYVNLAKAPLSDKAITLIKSLVEKHKENTITYINRFMANNDISFLEMVEGKKQSVSA